MYQPADKMAFPSGRDAFTLVEVLIVVAIIGLMAAGLVVVSSYVQTQGRVALTDQSVKLLSTAVAQFHDITGHYPVDNWGSIASTGSRIAGASSPGTPNPDELLYLQLSLLPQTRAIISKLPEELVRAPTTTVQLAHDPSANTPYLQSIVDPWDNPLDYDASGSYPVIQSAGPDGDLATTEDNISNED